MLVWKNFKKLKSKHVYPFVVLSIIFFIFKIFSLFKVHQVIWDEAVYIGMGKFLFSFGQSGLWESIRPIGLPLLLGSFWKLNLDVVFFSELLVVIFSFGNIFLSYIIARKVFDYRSAFFSALFLILTPIFFLYSSYILTGIASTFFALLALYFFLCRDNLAFTGFFSALAFLFRFPNGLILFAIFLALFFGDFFYYKSLPKFFNSFIRKFKGSYPLFLSFFLTTLPFFIFNFFLYNEYTSKFYHAVFRPLLFASSHQSNPVYGLMSFFDSFSFYFSNLLSQNFLLIFFFIAIFFFIFNHDYKNFKITSVFIIFSVYWLYFTSIVNKQPRFVLVFVPYLAILSAYGFISLINFLKKQPFLVHIPSFLFLSFIFLFSVFGFFGHVGSLNVIDEQFGWRVNEEFPIVSEYYSLFNFSSSLPILTTDPLPVVYSDNLFIPFYFSVDEGISIYVTNRLRAKTVIFSDSSFICYNQDCNDKLDNLFFDINNRFDKSFEKKFGDRTYYIFSRKG